MEPTADGLVEVATDTLSPAPGTGEPGGELHSNGHDAGSINGGALDENQLLHALQAMRFGDFSVRLPVNGIGLSGKIADTFNEIVAANQRMAQQLEHVGQVVGREGKTRQRVKLSLSHVAR